MEESWKTVVNPRYFCNPWNEKSDYYNELIGTGIYTSRQLR